MSADHPGVPFVQASGYTNGRPDGPPLWIVIHDMEAHETPTTAENTAQYFATGAGGRSVSSHYCVDSNSVVQCVNLDDVAWTVGNRPGNNRGINWELAGFASQTRAQWLDDFGRAMFAQMAPIVRSDAARFNIPLERRTIAELKAFKPGVTSHNDLGKAFGGTDHTDPGPNFPWDVFLAAMAPTTREASMILLYAPDGGIWLANGFQRKHISTPAEVERYQAAGVPGIKESDLDFWGADVAQEVPGLQPHVHTVSNTGNAVAIG